VCVQMASHTLGLIFGSRVQSLPRLRPEWENVVAGIDAALSSGDVVSALRICGSLSFWSAERPGAGLAIAERVISRLDGTEPPLDRAWGLLCVGCLRSRMGEHARANEALAAARDLFEASGERVGLMDALYWLAHTGDSPEAVDRVIELAIETSQPYVEGWAYLVKTGVMIYNWTPESAATRIPFSREVEHLVDQAETLADKFDFELLRSGVLDQRLAIRIINTCLNGSWASIDDELDPMLNELEKINRANGGPGHVAEALLKRNQVRLHSGRCSEARLPLIEQLQLSSLADNRQLMAEGILLAASVLDSENRHDLARQLIAEVAPTYCSYMDRNWMRIAIPSTNLLRFALAHAEGSTVDTAGLHGILDRCQAMLSNLG
jgi:hypothetical protein